MLPSSLQQKLDLRKQEGALRTLRLSALSTDFCSNDYLGIARDRLLSHDPHLASGSTGSRLLAGNYPLLGIVEDEVAAFHGAEAALLYNSGYDANVGLMSCVPQKGDIILYDALAHASIRDGIRLSFARAFSFRHNDVEDLENKLKAATGGAIPSATGGLLPSVTGLTARAATGGSLPSATGGAIPSATGLTASAVTAGTDPAGAGPAAGNIYVVTETLFSMDGDLCPLRAITDCCRRYGAWLIVDEAHATGVIGERGEGLVQQEKLEAACFARVHTFGKALGAHGAVILGSDRLKQYLVNFSRALIYTTALPPASAGLIRSAYNVFPGMDHRRKHLQQLIACFQSSEIPFAKLPGTSPIQVVLIPGNERVRGVASVLQSAGLDVRPILYPTVPKETERLRVVLHAFNTEQEVQLLVRLLNTIKNT
jgi:8-amino-7-oxononanoate synthase